MVIESDRASSTGATRHPTRYERADLGGDVITHERQVRADAFGWMSRNFRWRQGECQPVVACGDPMQIENVCQESTIGFGVGAVEDEVSSEDRRSILAGLLRQSDAELHESKAAVACRLPSRWDHLESCYGDALPGDRRRYNNSNDDACSGPPHVDASVAENPVRSRRSEL